MHANFPCGLLAKSVKYSPLMDGYSVINMWVSLNCYKKIN